MHARLEVVRGGDVGKRYELAEDEIILGRGRECHIVLGDASASRQHARLFCEDDAFVIEDLQSTNQTYVNGEPVEGKLSLVDQDQLRIGGTLLLFSSARSTAILETEGDYTTVLGSLDAVPDTEMMVKVNAQAKLRAILQINQTLSRSLDLETLLSNVLDGLFEVFPYASRALVLFGSADGLVPRAVKHRDGEEGTVRYSKTIVERVMADRQAILSQDASHDDRFGATESIVGLQIRSIMCVPLLSREMESLGVIQLETQHKRAKFDTDDVQILASVANQVSILIEYARQHKEILKQAGLRRELDFAAEVQRDFLPQSAPELEGYCFWPFYLAAGQVGGDYYDFLTLPGGNQVVLLADVAGKGVPAALKMAKASTMCKVALLSHADNVAQAMNDVNREICNSSSKGGFVTLALCVIDPKTHQITVANAGHLSPLRRRVDGTVDELIDRKVSGCPLGVLDNFQYQTVHTTLEPGEIVVLFSDGITEARNADGELFSIRRVHREVAATRDKTPEEVGRALIDAVHRHAGEYEQNDDISLVIFGRNPL